MSEKQQEYMARLRNALLGAISEDDMREIGLGLVKEAKRGDPQALRTIRFCRSGTSQSSSAA